VGNNRGPVKQGEIHEKCLVLGNSRVGVNRNRQTDRVLGNLSPSAECSTVSLPAVATTKPYFPVYDSSTTVQSSARGVPAQKLFTAAKSSSNEQSAAICCRRVSSKNSPLPFSASVTPSVTIRSRSPCPSR